jgi:hypothetical protein
MATTNKTRDPRGKKAFAPTQDQRNTVSIMAACGMPHHLICMQIKNDATGLAITPKTLGKYFADELANGLEHANAMVAQSLFKKAIGTAPQNVTAAIFWLKTRGKWRTVDGIELTGKDGAAIETATGLTDAQLDAIAVKMRQKADELDAEV